MKLQRRIAQLVLLCCFAACERAPPRFPAATSQTASETLVRVRELAGTHRVTEALEEARAYGAGRDGAALTAEEALLWEEWAALLVRASRFDEAVGVLDALWRSNTTRTPRAFELRAEVALASGDHEKALKFSRLLRLESGWRVFARASLAAGRTEDARAAVAAALLRDPWLDEGYLELGRLLARDGNPLAKVFLERYRSGEGYRADLARAVEEEFAGNAVAGLLLRARAERQRGRLAAHMRLCNEALELEPSSGSAYLELAELSLLLERPWDALEVLEKLPRRAEVDVLAGEAYLAAGDLSRARERFRAAGGEAATGDRARAGLAALEREPTAFVLLRRDVARRIREKPLSASTPELWEVAQGYLAVSRKVAARRLGLFLVHLRPEDRQLRVRVAGLFDEPSEVFFQLGLLERVLETEKAVNTSLERIGIPPGAARAAALQGELRPISAGGGESGRRR